MIILITYIDEKTKQKCVSHGVNLNNDSIVTLPNMPLFMFDAKFDNELMEYVLV
jgi:hypothetical protein